MFVLLVVLALVTSCQSPTTSSHSKGIAYGENVNGLICGIRIATRSPCRLDVFVKNVGDELRTFTISRKNYNTWADIFVDGKHFYPTKDTPVTNHAVGPEEFRILPGETRRLPWCYVPLPDGTHSVCVKYWLNQSPTRKCPKTPPFFESGTLIIDSSESER